MDPIKEAFSKIKEDILLLKEEINNLNIKIAKIQETPTYTPIQTHQHTNTPTQINTISTNNNAIEPLYTQNTSISIGNNGVPTHQHTNTPTHQPTQNLDFKEVNTILESLDTIKKGIRLKFKRLTTQEMLVFSTIYTLEEQKYTKITYKTIATQLNLSESSIRDYVNKLINKGIPIEKTKQNNKTIILKISQDLKNIATLTTIETLRTL
jgi:predicted transcriptional regulator